MTRTRSKIMLALFLFVLMTLASRVTGAETLVLAAAETRPTAFLVDGKPTGVLVDLVTEAFSRSGHTLTIKLMPWARCLESARTGQVDGVFSSFKLPEREKFLYFPKEPLSAQSIVFFARHDSRLSYEGDLAPLRDVRIGTIIGTSYGRKFDAALSNGTFRDVEQTTSIESNLRKLGLGRVDLVPSFRDVAIAEAKRLDLLAQIRELSPAIESVPTFLALTRARDMRKLADAFDIAMRTMRQDGTYDRIAAKYAPD